MAFELSKQQIDEFFEVGFIVVPKVFQPHEIEAIGSAMDRLTKMASQFDKTTVHNGTQFVVEGNRIDRIVWVGSAEPDLLKYAEDARVLNPASQILNSRSMDQLVNQFHPKLPGDKVKFDWHQDSEHRRYGTPMWEDLNGRGSYVQTLTAVDPVTIDNGPVYFIPKSGKYGHLYLNKNKVEDLFDLKQAVPLLMNPGDVAYFGPYVIHGSQPNESNKPRRVFINGYAYPGANKRVYPGEGSGRRLYVHPDINQVA